MSRILTAAERDDLAKLIAEVELNTAGEIVTAVVRRSSDYAAQRIGWAAAVALLVAAGLHLVLPDLPAMELLGAEALCLAGLYWIFGFAPLLRRLVPRRLQRFHTDQRAKQLFLELGVTETRDRSGILILLSELERRVEILGDRGIHEQLGTEAWQAQVANLVSSIRQGSAAAGLRQVIETLGRELAANFPARPDDTDELPNRVVIDA